MPSFLTQYGNALLDIQEKIQRGVREKNGRPLAPNLVLLWLDRSQFFVEYGGVDDRLIEEFRKEICGEINQFINANGWQLSAPLSMNILFEESRSEPSSRAEHREVFFSLCVQDDRGTRRVDALAPTLLLGRDHTPAPRNFISVADLSRSFSREHLLISLKDCRLQCRLLGMNTTFLNGVEMNSETIYPLSPGDRIECGPHSVEFERFYF